MTPLPGISTIVKTATRAALAALVWTAGFSSAGRADALHPATASYRASATASGNSYSPVFSADGRSVAFVGHANNLVTNDGSGPYLDAFVRDLAARKTFLLSVSTNGVGGADDDVRSLAISSNSEIAVFETAASNLWPGDANGIADIYVRDRKNGATRLVSVVADGIGAGNGRSFNPLLSVDGRYVVFESLASNLVTNDFNGTNDIFIRDLQTEVTSLVSVDLFNAGSADGPSHSASISADGLRVAFVSGATNLVAGVSNRLGEVYVRDVVGSATRWAGASHIPSTWTRNQASGQLASYRAFDPILSADGHYVAFKTDAATVRFDLQRPVETIERMATNGNNRTVFVFNDNPRVTRAATAVPLHFRAEGRLLFLEAPTNLPGGSFMGGIARVDFENLQTNWTYSPCGGCQGGTFTTNVFPSSELILTNTQGLAKPGWSRMNWLVSSPDGAMLYFLANLTNAAPGESTLFGTRQIHAFDTATRQIHLVSTNRSGGAGPDLGDAVPTVDGNVSHVAWDSPDSNIVVDDLNRAWDVFVRDLGDGTTTVVSTPDPALPGAISPGLASGPIRLSADGTRVAFVSADSSLIANDTNQLNDIFVRDLANPAQPPVSSLSLPPVPGAAGLNGLDMADGPVLSADGRYLAFSRVTGFALETNRSIYWADLSIPTNRLISSQAWTRTMNSAPVMSADGRWVAYSSLDTASVSEAGSGLDVFLVSTHSAPPGFPGTGTNPSLCVSTVPDGTSTGNGASVEPLFSPDGSWIIFRSAAQTLVREYLVNTFDYQLYARRLGCSDSACLTNPVSAGFLGPTRLLSYDVVEAQGQSRNIPLAKGANSAAFSGDSRWVVFASGTDEIHRHDLYSELQMNVVSQHGAVVTNRYRPPNVRVCTGCGAPSVNDDGNLVAYESRTGGVTNIYCRNLTTDAEELISANRAGTEGNGRSFSPTLSQDGRFVVFVSQASDLVANDNNAILDVFVRDRWNNVTHCLSANMAGAMGNHVSSHPVLSADGRTVAFQSFADDLVAGDYNQTRDIIVATLAGPDTDADGLDDELELAYFNTLSRDGTGDFDSDGVSDALEIRSGTNPADGNSVLGVTAISTGVIYAAGFFTRVTYLTWRAAPGRRYRVQYRSGLSQETWEDLPGEVVTLGTTGSFTHVTPIILASIRGFYRVKQLD